MEQVGSIQGSKEMRKGEVGPSLNWPLQSKNLISTCYFVSAINISQSNGECFDPSLKFPEQCNVPGPALQQSHPWGTYLPAVVRCTSKHNVTLPCLRRLIHKIRSVLFLLLPGTVDGLVQKSFLSFVPIVFLCWIYSEGDVPTKR